MALRGRQPCAGGEIYTGSNPEATLIIPAVKLLDVRAHLIQAGWDFPKGQAAVMNSILDDIELQALQDALEDEYKAHTTYDQVIHDLGPVRPFINIVDAEARHISALLSLFEKYGIAAPWPGKVPRFSSIHEACAEAPVRPGLGSLANLASPLVEVVHGALAARASRWRNGTGRPAVKPGGGLTPTEGPCAYECFG